MYQQQYQQYYPPQQQQQQPQQHQSSMMPSQRQPQAPSIVFYFYYKSHCGNSNKVMNELRQYGELVNQINFIPLDNYYINQQGQGCVQLQNGAIIPIPPQVKGTPTLLAVQPSTNEVQCIPGNSIMPYLGKYIQFLKKQATQGNDSIYEFEGFKGSSNVFSDTYTSLSELDRAPDFDNPEYAGNGMAGVNLAAGAGRGLLDQSIAHLKDNPDPARFGGKIKDRDHQSNTQYNQNQFRIQQEFQTPDQFPDFFSGQGDMPARNTGMTYNPDEMAPPPPTAIPRQLTAMETKRKRENYEGIESETNEMLKQYEAKRNAAIGMGGRGRGGGGGGRMQPGRGGGGGYPMR
jgi:hypothetical protein